MTNTDAPEKEIYHQINFVVFFFTKNPENCGTRSNHQKQWNTKTKYG
jgi:hypothetical protein